MRSEAFQSEAAECRRQAATAFAGKPEEPFLLRLAGMFEELGREPGEEPRQSGSSGHPI